MSFLHSLRRAAADRRSEVKPKAELIAQPVKPAERRLIRMLVEAEGFREHLAKEMLREELHRGLETQKIFEALLQAAASGARPDAASLAELLPDRERRLVFEILFEPPSEPRWEEAESCLSVLRRKRVEEELTAIQKEIEARPEASELRQLLARKQELRRQLAAIAT